MYTLIESLDDLAFLNKELLLKEYVGVDTEFRRTNKDNMKLALLQVKDEEEIYLIDTLAIENPNEHVSFLFSNSLIKIFHSCKEDLEAIYAWSKKEMINIFDTQLANSFLGDDYSISYQGLVEKRLDINLEKKETRSNWMRRPLTDDQLKYAALDVEYLIELYLIQKDELFETNKLKWHNQEIEKIINNTFHLHSTYSESERVLSKAKESELLLNFNNIIKKISKREGINSTLLFSKKLQKDFLRLIYDKGLDIALNELTEWRATLIENDLLELIKE